MRSLCLAALMLMSAAPALAQLDPFEERTGEVAITPPADGGPVTVDLSLPGSGYLRVESADPERPVTAELFDGSGRLAGTNVARLSDVEGATTRLTATEAGFPDSVILRFGPEMDFAEPNDAPDLAFPVAPGEIFEAVLFPRGDVDHFAITLAERARLSVHFQPGRAAEFAFLTAQGVEIPPDAVFEAGEHVLRLTDPDKPHDGPRLIEALVLAEPVDMERALTRALSLVPGRPAAVIPDGGFIEASFEAPEAGLYSLSFSNASGPAGLTWRREGGETLQTSDVHLPAGRHAVIIDGLQAHAGPHPVFATLHRRAALDPLEPNDFSADAVQLDLGADHELVFEPGAGPEHVQITGGPPGPVYLELDRTRAACHEVTLSQIDASGEPALLAEAASTPGRPIWGPFDTAGGPITLRFTCGLETFNTSRMGLRAMASGAEAGALPVYVIGVELDEGTARALDLAVSGAGGRFVPVAEASEIAVAVQDIAREEDRGRRSGPGWLVWLILAIAALGGGVYWMRRRF